jgi:hypothetical protein
MRRFCARHTGLGAILLTLPVAVAVEVPEDSSLTQIRVAAGAGSYLSVVRDCEGDVISVGEESFSDLAVSIDHKFGGTPLSVGVGGGFLHDGRFPSGEGYYYVNPNVGLLWGRFGLALGANYFTDELLDPDDVTRSYSDASEWLPSVGVRIGRASGPYMSAALLSSFPLYSDGGYLELGLGGLVSPSTSLWAGVSVDGLTATGLAGRVEWRMTDRFYLDAGASYGQREGEPQYGGNIGVAYRVIH